MVFLLLMTKGELSLDMTTIPDHSLVAFLAQVPDFRRDDERTTHRLVDILTIAVCAVLCGANSWTDMETFGHAKENWFRQFLALPEGLPSHDTYRRVFMLLAPEAWQPLFQEWAVAMQERCRSATGLAPAINIDGKHLRGTRPPDAALLLRLWVLSFQANAGGRGAGGRATRGNRAALSASPVLPVGRFQGARLAAGVFSMPNQELPDVASARKSQAHNDEQHQRQHGGDPLPGLRRRTKARA